MSVFEKIENALKSLDARSFTTRIAPLAIATIVSATAVACYAGPPPGARPETTPENHPSEVSQPDSAPPAAGAPVAPSTVPAAKAPPSKK